MVKAADPREGDNRRRRCGPGLRRPSMGWIPQARVDPLSVVVGHVVGQKSPEVTFAEDDDVIQKLTATGSHPSLGERVLPGTAVRRAYRFKTRFRIAVVTSAEKIESRS
jgi:hypothetical protein